MNRGCSININRNDSIQRKLSKSDAVFVNISVDSNKVVSNKIDDAYNFPTYIGVIDSNNITVYIHKSWLL